MQSHCPPALRMIAAAALAIMAGTSVAPLAAQEAGRSPFMMDAPSAAPAPAPASPLDRYELRGLVTIVDTTFVTLFDTSTSKSVTIELDQSLNGVKVSDLRPDGDTVSILAEAGGQARRFKMRESKIVTAVAAPPPPPPGVQPAVLPIQPNVAAANPISDEEARRRMQNVAEEIRRRRELRRDALERAQQQGGGPPAPPQR